jgi:rhamnose transport system ATP-binding protein
VLLEVEDLHKSFGGSHALRGVNFACDGAQIHGLVGENGAGKSTLLKTLAGAQAPDRGEIRFQGQPIREFTPASAAKRGIATIYQELSIVPALTVAENIYIGREPLRRGRRVDRVTMNRNAEALLQRIGLAMDPSRRGETLGIAEQQAVEIARAVSRNAKLLILDEPTAALADKEAENLFGILRALAADGAGVIFVSHRLYEVLSITSHITVLKDGQIVTSDRTSSFDEARLISAMVGRDLQHTFPPKARARGEPVLRVENLSAADGSFGGVDLELRRGEVLGVAGLEGHGQRELLRAIFGLEKIATGAITLGQTRLEKASTRRRAAAGLAFVTDDRKGEGLILPFDVQRNIGLATMRLRQTLGFIQTKRERAIAFELGRRLQVNPLRTDVVVRHLSGGNQQKVVLAKWLVTEPRVLMLAEPTRGIDVGTKVEIYGLLRTLANQGMGIIVMSRDMIELLGLADRVAVMADGAVVKELDGDMATEESIMKAIVQGGGGLKWRGDTLAGH